MNYLDLTNNVIRRMREEQVTSLYENQQSTVVADLVNDAKRVVEDAHDWSCLATDMIVPTVAGTTTYPLTNSQNRATIIDVRDVTNGAMLHYVDSAWVRRQELTNNVGQTRPSRWTESGIDSNGDTLVKFWGTPDGVYRLSFHVILRTGDLTAEGSTTALPHMPIIHLAHAMAAQERGDVDGNDAGMLFQVASKSLSDAIMYDMAKKPETNIWYPS